MYARGLLRGEGPELEEGQVTLKGSVVECAFNEGGDLEAFGRPVLGWSSKLILHTALWIRS